ncbi:hypothetical protein Noda2021_01760 [Candidatus Dependentiae bacterium Noda2021]|nr:hypothetical protein Noda2021_01760 [Candidatus Dependentiae bacterium Noda2021]
MKILSYKLFGGLMLLTAFAAQAGWPNGNVVNKVRPRSVNSGWTSVNFIDRVNAWQERVPVKATQSPQVEPSVIGVQEVVVSPIAQAPTSFVEKAKALMINAKDMALDAVKNAYSSPITQDVVKNIQDNKKVAIGFVVGATALYGGYKLYSYLRKSSPSELSADISKQEKVFQANYARCMKKSKTAQLVSSLNSEAQTASLFNHIPGSLPDGAQLKPYVSSRTL